MLIGEFKDGGVIESWGEPGHELGLVTAAALALADARFKRQLAQLDATIIALVGAFAVTEYEDWQPGFPIGASIGREAGGACVSFTYAHAPSAWGGAEIMRILAGKRKEWHKFENGRRVSYPAAIKEEWRLRCGRKTGNAISRAAREVLRRLSRYIKSFDDPETAVTTAFSWFVMRTADGGSDQDRASLFVNGLADTFKAIGAAGSEAQALSSVVFDDMRRSGLLFPEDARNILAMVKTYLPESGEIEKRGLYAEK